MCPSGVRYCSPSVARICSRWAGSASSRSSVISPPRWPIVAGSPATVDRYVKRSGGCAGSTSRPGGPESGRPVDAEHVELGQRPALGGEERHEQALVACCPASTMRQLAHLHACRPRVGAPVAAPRSRIGHAPTTARRRSSRAPPSADARTPARLAADAAHRVEEHLVAARRAGQPLHSARSLARRTVRDIVHVIDGRAVRRTGCAWRTDGAGPRRHDRPPGAAQRRRLRGRRGAARRRSRRSTPTTRLAVAVLTGAGGYFCAGADLKALADGDRRPVGDDGPGPMGPTRLRLSQAGDRRHRGTGRRRRTRARAVVRPPRRRRGRRARRLLPALRGAARRPRHDQPAPSDRPQPGDRPDPHRSRRRRRRGRAHRPRQPGHRPRRRRSPRPSSSPPSWPRCRSAACATTGSRRSSSGTSTSTRRHATRRAAAGRRSTAARRRRAPPASPPAPDATASLPWRQELRDERYDDARR